VSFCSSAHGGGPAAGGGGGATYIQYNYGSLAHHTPTPACNNLSLLHDDCLSILPTRVSISRASSIVWVISIDHTCHLPSTCDV
jgi:hypothetical protein